MLVVTCPHCRSSVLQNTDGTCPACGKAIPPESQRPLVVHSTFVGAGSPSEKQTAASGPWMSAGRAAPFVAPAGEHPMLQFRRQLWKNTPRVYANKAMVVINVAVFVLMVLSGVSLMAPDVEALIAWGANFGPMTLDGQWWRLLTSMFVHVGLLHVGLNMWVLWSNGELLERLTGPVGFLILYVLSGLFGSLASVYWNSMVASAGASGAIFGVFGGMIGFLLLRRDSVPKHLIAGMRRVGFSLLIYIVVTSIAIPFIDNAAHVGGFVAGLVCGAIMSQPLDRVTAASRRIRNLAAIALGMLGLAVALWAAPSVPPDVGVGIEAEALDQQLKSVYEQWMDQLEKGLITEEQLADTIESELLQRWHAKRLEYERVPVDDLPERRRENALRFRDDLQRTEQWWQGQVVTLRQLGQFDAFERDAMERWNDALRKHRDGQLSDMQLARYAETEILPQWEAFREQFDRLDFSELPPAIRDRAEKERRYLQLRENAWRSYIVAVKVQDAEMMEKYQADTQAAEAITAELRARERPFAE